jgi:hypothetical protein
LDGLGGFDFEEAVHFPFHISYAHEDLVVGFSFCQIVHAELAVVVLNVFYEDVDVEIFGRLSQYFYELFTKSLYFHGGVEHHVVGFV